MDTYKKEPLQIPLAFLQFLLDICFSKMMIENTFLEQNTIQTEYKKRNKAIQKKKNMSKQYVSRLFSWRILVKKKKKKPELIPQHFKSWQVKNYLSQQTTLKINTLMEIKCQEILSISFQYKLHQIEVNLKVRD